MSARDVYAAAVAVRRWTDETQTVVTTEDVLVHHVARAITQAREEGGRRGPMGLRDKIRAWLGVPVLPAVRERALHAARHVVEPRGARMSRLWCFLLGHPFLYVYTAAQPTMRCVRCGRVVVPE